MARPRYLSHAPITEALIDIRAQLPDEASAVQFEPLRTRLASAYPKVVTVQSLKARVTRVSPEKLHPTATQAPVGLIFKDSEEKSVVQFRLNGFTFNRLAPYSNWETIFPETMRLWREYVDVARPVTVVRLAARYINRLRLPLAIPDLSTYLTAPPQIPEGIPQSVRSFLTRVVVVDQQTGHSAILTQALETLPVDPGHLSVLLDVDAYRDVEYADPNDLRIERVLNELRQVKNNIFFSSITEAAAELYT